MRHQTGSHYLFRSPAFMASAQNYPLEAGMDFAMISHGPGRYPPPDPGKVELDLEARWGNGEAEIYTTSPTNVFQDDRANLLIRASRDAFSPGRSTSARSSEYRQPGASTHTADRSWQYGRIQAHQASFRQGVWPASGFLARTFGSVSCPLG